MRLMGEFMDVGAILRWGARLLSLTLTVSFAVFLAAHLGQGQLPVWPPSWQSLSFFLLLAALIGLLLAWRFETGGALLSIVGMAGFYVNDFQLSGFRRWPSEWVFPLIFATALMYLTSARLNRIRRADSAALE